MATEDADARLLGKHPRGEAPNEQEEERDDWILLPIAETSKDAPKGAQLRLVKSQIPSSPERAGKFHRFAARMGSQDGALKSSIDEETVTGSPKRDGEFYR